VKEEGVTEEESLTSGWVKGEGVSPSVGRKMERTVRDLRVLRYSGEKKRGKHSIIGQYNLLKHS